MNLIKEAESSSDHIKLRDIFVQTVSGYKTEKNPEGDIEILFTGLRPGEKLFEELLIGDNVGPTEHKQIYRANEEFISWKELNKYLNLLKEAVSSSNHTQLRNIFKQTVSGYKPEEDIVDVIYLEQNKTS